MDALANGCIGSMDVIMVWAWMHWPVDAWVAWTFSWFGHGCGMDALASGCLGSLMRTSETEKAGQTRVIEPTNSAISNGHDCNVSVLVFSAPALLISGFCDRALLCPTQFRKSQGYIRPLCLMYRSSSRRLCVTWSV